MDNRSVLISGASIAGPALALWLNRYGFRTTVVERAPSLRAGGHAVDFRGPAHMTVLARMGVLEKICAAQTHGGTTTIVDTNDRALVTFPACFTAGEVEIQRGDLSKILYDETAPDTRYLFGDFVTSIAEHEKGVDVTFAHGADQTFDLVIGADGLHSGVRSLVFGDESKFLRFHGYYVAGFTGSNALDLDRRAVIYSEPGKSVSVGSGRHRNESTTLFLFASRELAVDRHDIEQQKRIVRDVYKGTGWHTEKLLRELDDARDLYFDSIGHVALEHCSRGRVALVGDAGYGGTIGGQGTGLAIVCAYVLAGELLSANGDHALAFERYERRVRDYAVGCQKGASRVGAFYAPRTAFKTWLRNHAYGALTSWPLAGVFEKIVTRAASSIDLPDYESAPVQSG